MYNSGSKQQAKKPVITSSFGAAMEFGRWMAENHFDKVKDQDGLEWQISVKASQIPDPNDAHGLLWQLKIHTLTRPAAADLVRTKTLNPSEDARIIEILGTTLIPMAIKPKIFVVGTPEQARVLLSEVLPSHREGMGGESFYELKRSLVFRFIDENMEFGGRLCGK